MIRGDPESPLRWVGKSTRKLARELNQLGHEVSHSLVANLLKEMEYSLQANKKSHEGSKEHPDRDAQFRYIDTKIKTFQKQNQPVVSVDTKKKKMWATTKTRGKTIVKKVILEKSISTISKENWEK